MAMQMLVGGAGAATPLLSLQALPAALASTPSAVWEPMIAKVPPLLQVTDIQTAPSVWWPVGISIGSLTWGAHGHVNAQQPHASAVLGCDSYLIHLPRDCT